MAHQDAVSHSTIELTRGSDVGERSRTRSGERRMGRARGRRGSARDRWWSERAVV